MKMIKTSIISLFLLFLIIIMIGTISASLAWLSIDGSEDVTLIPGTFEIETLVNVDTNTSVSPTEKGVYKFNGLSESNYSHALSVMSSLSKDKQDMLKNDNPYVENLTITISFTKRDIPGYLRVRINDEWIVTRQYLNFDKTSREIIFKDQTSSDLFELEEGWIYDAKTNYYYYTNLIEKGEGELSIPFLEQISAYNPKTSSYYVEVCEVNLSISVQVVQANRYEALWGIQSIPTASILPLIKGGVDLYE